MLTMAEKTFLGLAIILSITLVGVVVLPVSSYEVRLVTSPNTETFSIPAGKPFNVTCKGLGDDAGKFSSFKWLNKKGQVIPEGIPGTKEEARNSLTLTFTDPKEDESGAYKCVANYEKSGSLKKSVSIIFHGNRPRFGESYENVTATENSFLEMLCAAEGELPITYEWYNQDEEKITGNSSSSLYVSNRETNASVLIIPTVSMNHKGTYTCLGSNRHGLSSKIFELTVLTEGNRPRFDERYESVTATENSFLEMLCAAEGELPITYEWYNQDQKKITGNSSSSIYVSNTETNASVLIIPTVSMNHKGTYNCLGSNRHGLSTKVFDLTVLTKVTPSFKSRVINVTATSVKFALNVTGPAKNIQVKYLESQSSTEYAKEFKLGDIYEIKDLIPAGLYQFMFRTSTEGWSRPYRVVLLPNKPEVIIRKIDSGTIRLEWIFKFDDRMRKTIDRHELTYFTVQMEGGNEWKPSTCAITIQLPECTSSSYTISGLSQNVYYEIQLRAHTASGYGEPYTQKIFMTDRL